MSARRLLCLVEEAMISERRAQQVALAAAAKFAERGDVLRDARSELADLIDGPVRDVSGYDGLERIGEVG